MVNELLESSAAHLDDVARPTPLPRVLLISRTRHALPLTRADAVKFAALREVVVWKLLARARADACDSEHVILLRATKVRWLDGALFHLRLPLRAARIIRSWRPGVTVTQDPYLGAVALVARRLARAHSPVLIEVHGDWRTATRLYGRRVRRLLAPAADRLAIVALRRADAVRAASPYAANLVRETGAHVDAVFPAFLDLEPFTASAPAPLPSTPNALFVGVLERYKNVDGLIEAWQVVTEHLPEARLRIVGMGTLNKFVKQACERGRTIEFVPSLSREEVARALDQCTCLVLPSRSEGMGRTVIEAFARGRPVIGSNVGGIPDLVRDRDNGLLVASNDADALANALIAMLSDPTLAARLGTNAHACFSALRLEPVQFAHSFASLIQSVIKANERSATAQI